MQYLLNIQRQIGSNLVIEAGYLGSESHHLYGFQNVNQGIPGTVGSATSRLPFANYGVIQMVADGFNAAYNSASIRVTQRYSHSLSMTGSYTYSKSIDNSSGIRVQGYDTLFAQNSNCLQCERSLSAFDTRNRLVLGGTYELPIGKGKPVNLSHAALDAVAGGWQMSGSFTVQSGVPQTIGIGAVDNSSTANPGYDRPIATLASTGYAADRTPNRWYDPAAFVEAPPGTFGNVGRNTLISPHFQAFDMAVHKEFRMPYSERHVLQFRFEAFNVLNHPSWGAPSGNILAGNAFPGAPATAAHSGFGVISTTSVPMRQLQLGLKYSF
jgi:hypothetical protein